MNKFLVNPKDVAAGGGVVVGGHLWVEGYLFDLDVISVHINMLYTFIYMIHGQ